MGGVFYPRNRKINQFNENMFVIRSLIYNSKDFFKILKNRIFVDFLVAWPFPLSIIFSKNMEIVGEIYRLYIILFSRKDAVTPI